ncbi:MAG: hypothetical protein U1F43_25900 [Myxococcota bacterium]
MRKVVTRVAMVALLGTAVGLPASRAAAEDFGGASVDATGIVPEGIAVRGKVERVVRWSDRDGEHVAVFASEGAPAREDADPTAVTLTVSIFRKVGGGYRRSRSWVERSGRCDRPGVTLDDRHLAVTDLDGDGRGELAFGIYADCPRRYTFTLAEGEAAWRRRYTGLRVDECSPIYRYSVSGSDFARAPTAFREAAEAATP